MRPVRRVPLGRRIGLALCLVLLAAAQRGTPLAQPFERIGPGLGLGAEMITALYQDRTGFLWVGTRQGLYLFDGNTFRRFEHDADDPHSLADSAIRAIFEDRSGRLWIGTNSGGLDLLDRANWTFQHLRHESADSHSLSHDSVNAIAEDPDGTLWVATQKGLNRLDPQTRTVTRMLPDPGHPPDARTPASAYVYSLFVDGGGALWVGTVGGGLSVRDPETGRFTHYLPDPSRPDALSSDSVFAITADAQGTIWLAAGREVCHWDPATQGFRCFPLTVAGKGAGPGHVVTSLAHGGAKRLWVGTLSGLYAFDPGTGTFRPATPPDDPARRGRRSRVISLLTDRSGTLWIGTWEDGLLRLGAPDAPFAAIDHGPDGAAGLGDVTALFGNRDGRLWLATSGGGLYLRDAGSATFRRDEPLQKIAPPGASLSLTRLLEDRDGFLWIGTTGALLRLDPQTGAVRELVHAIDDPASIGAGFVTALAQDRDGVLWVGTGEGGLQRLGADGRSFERFVHDPADQTTISDNYVTAIREARDGRLWVGTRSGGLNLFDRRTGRFRRFRSVPGDPTSLSHHYVTSILEDPSGALWIGTSGGGLDRLESVEPEGAARFTHVTAKEGLADNNVMALAADDDGSLWISTREGLSRFDPRRRIFRNYDAADGLPSSEFEPAAVASGETEIYFGTIKGAVAVRRGTPFPEVVPSPTVIASIRTLSGPVAAGEPVWALDELEIPYGEVLIFDFAVLDYSDPSRHRYAYRLGGDDARWVDLGATRSITFSRLDPGRHELRVRGRDASGIFSETAHGLVIRVVPPFWMTTWFRLLASLALLGAVSGWHLARTRRLERRNRELLELQDQREQALRESREKEERLRDAYDRLRALTRRLEAAKEDERKRIARELHDEMGQALTAAKITLDLAERAAAGGARGGGMEGTASLLDRIIDRVRDLSLDLRPPLLDERGLIPALRGYLEAQSRRAGVAIEVDAPPDIGRFPPELEIAGFRVIQESVTNALRHAAAARIAVRVARTEDGIEVAVRDDGRGFDLDAAMVRAAEGRHLGLLGIRERVEMLGGRAEIRSSPGRGTEIRATLPLEPPA